MEAALGLLNDVGLTFSDVDGLGVSSFSLGPDHAIDLAWRLTIQARWIMQDPHGGASGINLLHHAVRAVEAGDASCILLLAGDHLDREAFARLVETYNRATADSLAPLSIAGPNALFAMLTKRHMSAHGLEVEDYAQIPIAQRRWAAANPQAVYRSPLTLEDYLSSPMVADPLRRYDCVPVVTGADAILVTRDPLPGHRSVRVRALVAAHNAFEQDSDGLTTGLRARRDDFWGMGGVDPADIDLACVYDDYPVMVLAQLADLGLIPEEDYHKFLHHRLAVESWPLNPSGGQLSVGQAGAAGGMHGLVAAVRYLQGACQQAPGSAPRFAVVTGYGMVLYRHGACANAALLEAGE